MRRVGMLEATRRVTAMLDEAAVSDGIAVACRDSPVVTFGAVEPGFDRDRARRTAAGLRMASKGVTLGGLNLKELRAEGRR